MAVIGIGIGAYWAYMAYTGDFSLNNIAYDLPFRQDWEIPSPSEAELADLNRITDQHFYFLGMGNQTYVFVSNDNRYVIKFFKFKHLKPSKLLAFLPSIPPIREYRDHKTKSQRKRIDRIFNAHKIAYMHDKNNSGLVYVHLLPTQYLNKKITVYDRLGFRYGIDLDQTVFVIQKKGITTKALLTELLNKGETALAKKRLEQLIELYLSDYKQGIYDDDHNVIANTGFFDDKPIRIDVGKIKLDEEIKKPENYNRDLHKIVTQRINKWISSYYPQYKQELLMSTPYQSE